ncbi:MAG: NAD(P)-dependent oxidoreductase, partial [Bacteroidota bacterium]
KAAPTLEFIGRAGAGIDNIDEKAVAKAGIEVFNAPEGNRDAVGEHAIGMLLMLLNNLYKGHQEIGEGIWDREGNRGRELGSLTVGIYGYGNTGSAFARKLSGFGCRIVAFDKYKNDIKDPFVEYVTPREFYEEADVVSIHVPLTSETGSLINEQFFQSFKKQIYVINTSRGKVLSLSDLLKSFGQGKILGACLDVLENEQLSTYTEEEKQLLQKLRDTGKIVFSPHVAGWTVESYRKISEVLSEKILRHYLASSRIA